MTPPAQAGRRCPTSTRVVVDGVAGEVRVHEQLITDVVLPELLRVAGRARPGRRSFVFLAGPPGAGKSTLAALLRDHADELDLDVVGIDGFHLRNGHLATHWISTDSGPVRLSEIKGAPETFDLPALTDQLERATTEDLPWPRYDRGLHEPVPGDEPVRAPVVVVEGNWLLLDEPGWAGLSAHSSLNIFLQAPLDLLRERLVRRKERGGLTAAQADDFYERSDRRNVERVLNHSDRSKVDLELSLEADGTIQRKARP